MLHLHRRKQHESLYSRDIGYICNDMILGCRVEIALFSFCWGINPLVFCSQLPPLRVVVILCNVTSEYPPSPFVDQVIVGDRSDSTQGLP